jgi:DNA gyrase subunit B
VREIVVRLNADKSCTVLDDGPGIPTDTPVASLSIAEAILTWLNHWPEHPWNVYGCRAGLHAVGVSIVNLLSSRLKLTIWRDRKEHFMEFRDGEALAPLAVVGEAGEKHGTEVTFLPNPKIFSMTDFDFGTLEPHLRKRAARLPSIKIVLSDMRHAVGRRAEMLHERSWR